MLLSTLISLVWIFLLLVLFAFFLIQYWNLKKIAGWPTTEGKITHFDMQEENQTFWPQIAYQYEVNGITHESHLFFPDTTHHTPQTRAAKKVAYQTAQAYLNDRPIPVHYNPSAPEQAVLDVKIPKKLIAILLILIGLILTEIILVIF